MSISRRFSVTKEEFIDELHKYYDMYGKTPRVSDFKGEWISYGWAKKLFGSWNNAIKAANLPVNNDNPYSYNKDQLLSYLLEYYRKYSKVPTSRMMSGAGYPSIKAYIKHFGSFKNALIESGLYELREDKHQFAEEYTDEELLEHLKKYMEGKERIPTYEVMKKDLRPSISTYDRRFNGAYNAFKLIGYDVEQQRLDDLVKLENDMIDKYKRLKDILGRVPSSRDIERYSREFQYGYSMSTYEFHFGSLYELQRLCGFTPTVVGRNKSKEDMLDDLVRLSDKLGKTPSKLDLKYFDDVASENKYAYIFGSWNEAILEAGLKPNNDVYYSNNGETCLSYYELLFTNMLEEYNIEFKKEEHYRGYIATDKRYRFDYVIEIDNHKYFVEIFGITCSERYDKRTEEKIRLCRENDLNLIEIYPDDFTSYKLDVVHSMLMSKISNMKLAS